MVHGQPDRPAGAVRLYLGINGFEPAEREMLALATIVGSISLTLVVWVVGYLVMGGPR
jgi:hypothetical protein